MSPLVPDADRLTGALGATYRWRKQRIDLGVQWQHFLDRSVRLGDIRNGAPDLPGTYSSELCVAGLGWTYSVR